MQFLILPSGQIRALYDEHIDWASLGFVHITRASHVEPDAQGRWQANLSPVAGPMLGPFQLRSQALAAEVDWLHCHHL